jgi:hypothetical protein
MEKGNQLQESYSTISKNGQVILTRGLLEVNPLSIPEAVKNGTLFRSISTTHPVQVKRWVLVQLARVVHRLAAKTTVEDEVEYVEIAREIYRQFPTLRIEEMQEVFDGMIFGRFGKYYERLKAAEFIDAFKQHEASEQRIAAFEQRHKRQAYAVRVTSTDELREVLRECIKRGYKLRTDHTTKGESKELFLVIDGTAFDYVTETDLVTMDAIKFTAPINYTKAGERIEARVMTNGEKLRKALQVDTKVMGEYIMSKPTNGQAL